VDELEERLAAIKLFSSYNIHKPLHALRTLALPDKREELNDLLARLCQTGLIPKWFFDANIVVYVCPLKGSVHDPHGSRRSGNIFSRTLSLSSTRVLPSSAHNLLNFSFSRSPLFLGSPISLFGLILLSYFSFADTA